MRVLGKEYVYPVYILKCDVCNTYLEYNVYDLHYRELDICKPYIYKVPYITCPVCNEHIDIRSDDPVRNDYEKLNNL